MGEGANWFGSHNNFLIFLEDFLCFMFLFIFLRFSRLCLGNLVSFIRCLSWCVFRKMLGVCLCLFASCLSLCCVIVTVRK